MEKEHRDSSEGEVEESKGLTFGNQLKFAIDTIRSFRERRRNRELAKEAAAMGVHEATLRRWKEQGLIRSAKILERRRFSAKEV